jgi:hypothetical protein
MSTLVAAKSTGFAPAARMQESLLARVEKRTLL